jgi:hypothetical protein
MRSSAGWKQQCEDGIEHRRHSSGAGSEQPDEHGVEHDDMP